MAKITKTEHWKAEKRRVKKLTSLFLLVSVCAWSLAPRTFSKELLNYTFAVVGTQVLTARSIALDYAFSPSTGKRVSDFGKLIQDAELLSAHSERAIQREMVRQYLSREVRFAENLGEDIDVLRNHLYSKWGGKGHFETFRLKEDIGPAEVQETLERYVYEARFLERDLGQSMKYSEEDIRRHYEANKERLFLDQPYGKIRKVVETNLLRTDLAARYLTWFQNEKKRTRLIILPQPQEDLSRSPDTVMDP